ncbi:ead/Ea22-like family protein [Enterobacter hormaechei]|uniref:ead/Ea22-like family protein n=1 Tax=Enterobacter hormaechei TaxID=158836 RepID=UPI00350ECCF3
MSNIDKQALRDSAESTINILENIAGFEPSDIDGDTVELRFETEYGFDTGCDVSIVDQCQKAADVVRVLLDELEAAEKRISEQKEVMRQAASDISYAIFNLTGSDLSRLQPGVVETTDPTDTALIAERNLRAAAAGNGE